jgi:hypothetical protein
VAETSSNGLEEAALEASELVMVALCSKHSVALLRAPGGLRDGSWEEMLEWRVFTVRIKSAAGIKRRAKSNGKPIAHDASARFRNKRGKQLRA